MASSSSYALPAVSVVALIVVGVVGYFSVTGGGSPAMQNTISVAGTGSTFVTPDHLMLSVGVETQAATASDALTANTQLMDKVVGALKAAGLGEEELSTNYFNVQPVYTYPKDSSPVLSGYKASNMITVSTNKTEKAGQYVDSAVASGANQVNFVYFTVSDEAKARIVSGLLASAVNDAKAKADSALAPLGLRTTGVQTVSIGTSGFPVAGRTDLQSSTPIMVGQQEVSVTVQVSFVVGPK